MKKIMFSDKYCFTQAVLEGRKTMTRRICRYDRPNEMYDIVFPVFESKDYDNEGNIVSPLYGAFGWNNKEGDFTGWNNPRYKVGEVVAIAQSYKDLDYDPDALDRDPKDLGIRGFMQHNAGWNNKMFVKAYACKHHIKITNVKIERLQDISDEDCLKEGVELNVRQYEYNGIRRYGVRGLGHWRVIGCTNFDTAREAFSALIDKVSGKGTWENNPFVWVYEFNVWD